mgnify:CR=1 FL=1
MRAGNMPGAVAGAFGAGRKAAATIAQKPRRCRRQGRDRARRDNLSQKNGGPSLSLSAYRTDALLCSVAAHFLEIAGKAR